MYLSSIMLIAVAIQAAPVMSAADAATGQDFALVKLNSAGTLQWTARYDGPGSGEDIASALHVDAAGNAYVTGWSAGDSGSSDYATIKYSADGSVVWVARYDGSGGSADEALALQVDATGNVIVTGSSVGTAGYRELTTVQYNIAGEQLAVMRFSPGGGVASEPRALSVDTAGNIYVAGWRFTSTDTSGNSCDALVIKYNAAGVQQWATTYNGPGSQSDRAVALRVDTAGNVYVAGGSAGTSTSLDYVTQKLNSSGAIQWTSRYDGGSSGIDFATALEVGDSGEVFVTGLSAASTSRFDYATVKYSVSGAQLWATRYDGPAAADDEATAMSRDAAGNVYVVGGSGGTGVLSDFATIKYAPDGAQLWTQRLDGPGSMIDIATAVAVDAGGRVHVAGQSWGASYDMTVIKYTSGNQPPVALADSFSTSQSVTLSVAAPGVLANDIDPDFDLLSAVPVSSPANGGLTLAADGSFSYTPNAGFVGADTFTYRATDGTAPSEPALVTINVLPGVIRNGTVADGRLELLPDAYGAFQIIGSMGNQDFYDPPGSVGGGHPSFSSGLFLFVGTTLRELLADSWAWQNTDLTLSNDPARYFSTDTSLSRSVTQACIFSDTNSDGISDTAESAFDVTGSGVDLSFELTQFVSQPYDGGPAYLRQDYTVTNQSATSLTFKLVRAYDGDLLWGGGAPTFSDDWVGVGRSNGAWYVYEREPTDDRLAVTLSSLTRPDAYYAGKTGIDPDGPAGDPPFDFGTSNEIWDAYGIPTGWRNFAAGVGRNTPGVSGSQPAGSADPYDAFIGLEFILTLAPGTSQTLTILHSYGSSVPLLLPPPCIGDLDGDGEISLNDLAILLAHYGAPGSAAPEHGDLNGDGDVDLDDLAALLAIFGSDCP
jgi:hypothetical protein